MDDEEIVMWALPFIENLYVAVEAWEKALKSVQDHVDSKRHWARKDFAIEMQSVYADQKGLFGLAMQLWQDKPVEDKTIRNFMIQFDKGIKGQFS